jgi:hypothetical protein
LSSFWSRGQRTVSDSMATSELCSLIALARDARLSFSFD